jgi:DNA-binding CsgD family transcriptional regulator
MPSTTFAEQQAFDGIKRVCYAGLDSVALRTEVARRLTRAVPTDADNFCTVDPDTGILNHGIPRNLSESFIREFLGHLYPDDEAVGLIEQARAGMVVQLGSGDRLLDALHRNGLQHDLRALFATPGTMWGSWCLLRGGGSPAFTDREIRFVERIAPHVAEGLKSAALRELAADRDGPGIVDEAPDSGPAPGFLVVGPRGAVMLRTPSVAPYLDDLGGPGCEADGRLPFAVESVRGRLLRMRTTPSSAPGDARLRARGQSGAWYSLRASLAEPDETGTSAAVISVERVARQEVGPLLFRLYGLSPREREVIVWVVRGEPTKRIATHLGLSVHTVQDYLDKACDKVGVRGRKALVARLFRDGFAPSLAA